MKRVFSIAVISCIFALSGLFTSCKPQEDVEWLFFIQLDSSTDYMVAQDRYECIIFPTMFLVMSDDADKAHSATFGFYGSESSALHRAKKSFKRLINQSKTVRKVPPMFPAPASKLTFAAIMMEITL